MAASVDRSAGGLDPICRLGNKHPRLRDIAEDMPRKESVVKRFVLALLLLGTLAPLSGYVVWAPARPGWCYWHPYAPRCR